MGKKVISFSLWGNDPKYNRGAIRNAELALEIYPGWECYYHVDKHVPNWTHHELGQFNNTHVVHRLDKDNPYIDHSPNVVTGDWRGMFWRFEDACNEDVDVMISRDCDSRLSLREAAAVEEWLESDKGFHIMRDHPWHGSQMLGGMWGCRGFALPEFLDLMLAWNQENRWQTDQDFLNTMIYPRVVRDAMVHASFLAMEPHAKPFPKPRSGLEFVGQVFDENEQTIQEHLNVLGSAL